MTGGSQAVGGGIERRIFVVGVPRSGTTLLQSLLAAHSRVTSFTESHVFSRCFEPLPFWPHAVLVRDPRARWHEFLDENHVRQDETTTPPHLPPRLFLPLHTHEVARRFLALLDGLAVARGKTVWIEKTPRHLRYLVFLERLTGSSAHFVHMIREGPETVASLRVASQHWERSYDLEECIRRWNVDTLASLTIARRQKSRRTRHHFVFYDDLTVRPRHVLEPLFLDLGLDWEPEILERYGRSAHRVVTGEESWKAGIGRAIRPSQACERRLDEDERALVEARLIHRYYTMLRELVGPSGEDAR